MTHAFPHSASKNLNFRAAWLSQDESDNEPLRFLGYLIAALQTIQPELGRPALAALQSPQPPPVEDLLTGLLNEIANLPEKNGGRLAASVEGFLVTGEQGPIKKSELERVGPVFSSLCCDEAIQHLEHLLML